MSRAALRFPASADAFAFASGELAQDNLKIAACAVLSVMAGLRKRARPRPSRFCRSQSLVLRPPIGDLEFQSFHEKGTKQGLLAHDFAERAEGEQR